MGPKVGLASKAAIARGRGASLWIKRKEVDLPRAAPAGRGASVRIYYITRQRHPRAADFFIFTNRLRRRCISVLQSAFLEKSKAGRQQFDFTGFYAPCASCNALRNKRRRAKKPRRED